MKEMIETIRSKLAQSEPFKRLSMELPGLAGGRQLRARGIEGSLMAFVAVHAFELLRKQVAVLVPDDDRAEELYDDCAFLLGGQFARLFGGGTGHTEVILDTSSSVSQLETLKALADGLTVLVVASAGSAAGKLISPDQFRRRMLEVRSGTNYPFEQLIAQLSELGFERKDFVEEAGDFAVRGGILDVFTYVGENPVRMEFWGDSIESIREFDALSQRSIRTLQAASIVADLGSSEGNPSAAVQAGNTGGTIPGSTLFDFLLPEALVILDQPEVAEQEILELQREGHKDILIWDKLRNRLSLFPVFVHSPFAAPGASTIEFQSSPQPPTNGSIKHLVQHLEKLNRDLYEIHITSDTKDESDRIHELIDEDRSLPVNPLASDVDFSPHVERAPIAEDAAPREVRYHPATGSVHSGFIYPPAHIALFTEHQVFGRRKRRGETRRQRFKGFTAKEVRLLSRGDFVVHVDYGVGRFEGLQKLRVRGAEQEVMKVSYADNDALYVHLNFIHRVEKYSSKEGHVPALTKLGSPEWERLKSRAKKRIKDIARDLIRLYAKRKLEAGFAFSPDSPWQREMEASFAYEDTPDQARATVEVKKDMEGSAPMDRLICGDVGFGKTEIAVRAAFKAVMDGKQVAVLVPTTILAQQHYNTFIDRLARYSVRIEAISRFKSKKEQVGMVESLRNGKIDIIIGTHRLLSKDVEFKRLGLLVIDEEHRFGVTAKEKLRRLRASVDTLTLTATPIPRTLQFSLMGARDLSLVNTPPRNRLPIITEIAQFDTALIREAILRELHRGGQVYVVHDRVQNIGDMQLLLEKNVPEARFHIAHGQMKGHDLEKAMMDFLQKKYDVLLCTKIIESGIDIPTVNTIIINRADRFGLAELYQLRGRVGRSNVRAFAYLLTPPISSLPKDALRRLQAIREFTELGSGFNLAMRDLEIRGAGNLLGAEQSGYISDMGFEMYQRIVEEAVQEIKEQEFGLGIETTERRLRAETTVEADVDALIPDFYVEADAERVDIYRRLYQTEAIVDLQPLQAELRDRFGDYPQEVEHLFLLVQLKILASSLGATKMELSGQSLVLTLPPPDDKPFYEGRDGQPARFQALMENLSLAKTYRAHLKQEGTLLTLHATIQKSEDSIARLAETMRFLQSLLSKGGTLVTA